MQNALLALRNIGRNRRRSAVTILAVALSAGGLTLFGGYVSWTFRAVEEQTVGTYGHLQIYKKGYYEEGAGDPTAHALDNYEEIKAMLQADPVISQAMEMVTPHLLFNGLVTCAGTKSSSTFVGLGVIPSEDRHVTEWNPYGLFRVNNLAINAPLFAGPVELDDEDEAGVSIGTGLGKVLKLDRPPPSAASAQAPAPPESAVVDGVDIAALTREAASDEPSEPARHTLELLTSPPGGTLPNVATVNVRKVVLRATKEMDDQFIKLHIHQASELLFPGKPLHATAVIILLRASEDTERVAHRLGEIIQRRSLPLEYKTWTEIRPFYLQMKRMLGIIFVFVFILLAMLVAFTIYNTQSAGILERLNELGTLRAMGVKRFAIWRMLVWEGFSLGLIGVVLGMALGVAGDLLLRVVDVLYIPPGVSFYAKVEVLVLRHPAVMLVAGAGCLACAVLSSALPARRAAYTPIVEALRHA